MTAGLIEDLCRSSDTELTSTVQPMNDSLPTEGLNKLLRRLLGRRIYEQFVEPYVIETQEDYWPERDAGNRWMARWVLVRGYLLMLEPLARALKSVVLGLKALLA